MKKIFKLSIASVLTITLSLATVICCCIAPSVMAHFHKAVTCRHCDSQDSSNKSSNPGAACLNQLTSAELSHTQLITVSKISPQPFSAPVSLSNYNQNISPILNLSYPPGGPPLGISFTPLYLRTFNLRI